jgi:hypothetical protein
MTTKKEEKPNTSPPKTRGRVKFILLFLLLLTGLHCLLNHLYIRMMSFSGVMRAEKLKQIYPHSSVTMLALGDSHVGCGLLPKIIKLNLFKWPTAGEGYIQNYYKLKSYLKDHRPNLLILPLDLHSFSSVRIRNIVGDYYWVKYIDYFELASITGQRSYFLKKYFKGKFYPYVGEGDTLFQWLALKFIKNQNQFIPQARKEAAKFDVDFVAAGASINGFGSSKAKIAAQRNNQPQNRKPKKNKKSSVNMAGASRRVRSQFHRKNPFDPTLVHYFKEILELCREKQIPVFLVKYPVSLEYFNAAAGYFSIRDFYKRIDAITENYPNIYLLDYQSIFFNKPQYLADSDHVNKKGAALLSKQIKDAISRLSGKVPISKSDPVFQGNGIRLLNVSNFGGVEGPYPEFGSVQVRWGFGPLSRIEFSSPRAGNAQITLRLYNIMGKSQNLKVYLNGNLLTEVEIRQYRGGKQEEIIVPGTLKAGTNKMEFRYSLWRISDTGRSSALLFSTIRIQ